MAIFRKIHTSFWSDSFIQDLDKDQKLFYLYLLTNERTKQCGVYEITKKQIAYDLGYTIDRVSILLKYFIKCGKIRYNEETKELAIGKWLKYNSSTSPKVQTCINTEFTYIKDTVLIEYVKSIDTLSQQEQEQEQEEEKEEKEYNNTCFSFIDFWNTYPVKIAKAKCEAKYKKLSETERQKIKDTINKFINYKPFDTYTHPHPETYINQQRWNDEIKVAEVKRAYPRGLM